MYTAHVVTVDQFWFIKTYVRVHVAITLCVRLGNLPPKNVPKISVSRIRECVVCLPMMSLSCWLSLCVWPVPHWLICLGRIYNSSILVPTRWTHFCLYSFSICSYTVGCSLVVPYLVITSLACCSRALSLATQFTAPSCPQYLVCVLLNVQCTYVAFFTVPWLHLTILIM